MTRYPHVFDELATLSVILAFGRSLARYGDGEFNLCAGARAKAQRHDPGLAERLRAILRSEDGGSGECLVGIPNIHSATPKCAFWNRYATEALPYLADRAYVSSFITRPDSAPWIDTPEYWTKVAELWTGRRVTLVRGSGSSLRASDLVGAADVDEVIGPKVDAWSDYDELLERIGTPERALLCLGPTATVMAVDLCARGVQAIDCGHLGMFWRKHRAGEPMTVTAADKVAWTKADVA